MSSLTTFHQRFVENAQKPTNVRNGGTDFNFLRTEGPFPLPLSPLALDIKAEYVNGLEIPALGPGQY